MTTKIWSLAFKDWPIRQKLLIPTVIFLVTSCTIYILAFFFLLNYIRDNAITEHKTLLTIEQQFFNTVSAALKSPVHPELINEELTELKRHIKQYSALHHEIKDTLNINEINQKIAKLEALLLFNSQAEPSENTSFRSLVSQLEHSREDFQQSIHKIHEVLSIETRGEINDLMQYVLLSAVIGIVIATYSANILASQISSSIEHLQQAVAQFRLKERPYKLNIKQEDEIGLLSKDFNSMMAEITFNKSKLEQAIKHAQNSNNAKSQFLANISHELRTPMLGIMGFSDLGIQKIDSADKEKTLRYFQRIKSSSQRLLSLVNDLLDLSKLESGQLELQRENIDLNILTKEVIDEMKVLISDKSIELSLNNSNLESYAYIDRKQIHQVIYNLLSNAIKYSEVNGSIQVTIDTGIARVEQHDELVEVPVLSFSCEDEGVGIPESELNIVFDKFAQSTKTVNNASGTGLGLAICKEIITAHQGRIYAKNRQPDGVRLTFEVPIKQLES